MGLVNNYIQKIINFFNHEEKNAKFKKPWYQYYGSLPEHLNYFKGSIYDNLVESVEEHSKKTAYEYFGTSCTYKGFLKKVNIIADALTQFDVVENECITLCLPNTPESFALVYAINKIGAIANVVHPLSSTVEIKRALDETNSQILFCSDVTLQKARGLKVKHFVLTPTSQSFRKYMKLFYNIKNSANLKLSEGMISWDTFIDNRPCQNIYVKRKDDDPAAIIYSGGTTGKPKGIIISNRNFNAMSLQTRKVSKDFKPGRSVLSYLPIFHVFGLALCCHTVLTNGLCCIIIPRLNTKKINKEFKKYKPDIIPAVPSILKLSLRDKKPGKNGFKFVKMVVVGGDYLPLDIKDEYEDFLFDHGSRAVVKTGYGMSESTGFCSCTAPLNEQDVKNGTLGIPNPDIDVQIFEVGKETKKSYGEVGEICISGPTIMLGYINEDEETKKTLVKMKNGKTWLRTGDLGYMDETGRLFYTSRLKRMIITNGYNIYPIELENIINACKYVSNCTVIGVPHKTKGQTPKVVIVLKKDYKPTSKIKYEIIKYCRENLAAYAIPSEFEYRDELPVTAVGKVAYRELEKK